MIETHNATDVKDIDWNEWTADKFAVITYIFSEGKVLLINKKRGLGAGKVNAPGGHIEEGETAVEAAVRETEEEVGLTPLDPLQCGKLYFQFTNGLKMEGTVFIAREYKGVERETDEADPFWVAIDDIPYSRMWEDDLLWLPHVIKGKSISGCFIFDDDDMVSYQLDII
ncbi:8-oxo-dGTP diphosphatase [Spirochaeta isovalerica]|uniref:Oxidized purine nucleoside triphosphate hydrolase n=1 Tax=Spirochaeta isovalerica TaxID=150 RepID=A0A841R716_9SPIO|nr:8-oxo-dGTP diphosphatase [Spirochaeta isovalerica]MBB6479171.1 8-oxo-dGTP diphosphatase [Spirochaeta isovalerica]